MIINISNLFADNDTLQYQTRAIEIEATRIEQSKILEHLDIQRIEITEIDKLHITNLTEKIKFLPNIFIKDYGGIGGIKTVSMRGAASSQTVIMIDGIPISSTQNSIVDFSSLPLTYFESIDVINNGSSSLFGTNSIGGTINLHSRIPKNKSIDISGSYGSYGYSNFSAISNSTLFKFPYFLNINYTASKGDYPFDYNDFGEIKKEKRQNSDFTSLNGGFGLEIPLNKSLISTKMFITNSERGVPGAVLLGKIENSSASLDESKLLSISNFFTKIDANNNNELKLLLSYSSMNYSDNEFLPNDNFANSYFISREIKLIDDFTINSGNTTQLGTLNFQYSNLTGDKLSLDVGNYVERLNLGIGYNISHNFFKNDEHNLSALLSIKYDYWSQLSSIFSYSAGINRKGLIENTDIKLLFSNNYRIPNFNEMYYLNYGTVDLKPEKSNFYSLSFDIIPREFIKINFNSYFIDTKDQIVAMPRSTISWSAQNIGKVQNYGISLNAQISLFSNTLNSMFSYTFQRSIDKTENSPSYNKLLPYLPQEIIAFAIDYKYKIISYGSDIYYNSFRYYSNDNSINSIMQSYYNIDFNISALIKILSNNLSISIIIKNITNQTYEIIKNYPMPKRNYILSISYIIN